jgi:hypothetical protein
LGEAFVAVSGFVYWASFAVAERTELLKGAAIPEQRG